MTAILAKYFAGISLGEVKGAADAAYAEYAEHMSRVRVRGGEIIAQARARGPADHRSGGPSVPCG